MISRSLAKLDVITSRNVFARSIIILHDSKVFFFRFISYGSKRVNTNTPVVVVRPSLRYKTHHNLAYAFLGWKDCWGPNPTARPIDFFAVRPFFFFFFEYHCRADDVTCGSRGILLDHTTIWNRIWAAREIPSEKNLFYILFIFYFFLTTLYNYARKQYETGTRKNTRRCFRRF